MLLTIVGRLAVTLELHGPWPAELAERTATGLGPLRSLLLDDGQLSFAGFSGPRIAAVPVTCRRLRANGE